MQKRQNKQPIEVSKDIKGVNHYTENAREILRLGWIYLCVEIVFKLLSEKGNRERCTNLNRKSAPNSGSIKSKTVTKLSDRILSRWMKLGENKCEETCERCDRFKH